MHTYIERDVRRVSDIQNLHAFGNFVRLLAAMSGCEMNYSQSGRELGVQGATAAKWVSVAQSTYQWESIPAFSRNPVKRIASKPKGYLTDTGFLCHLININSPREILHHPSLGALVETYLMNEIIKLVQESQKNMGIYHFRTQRGAEVDCVIEHDGKVYLIEIKTSSKPTKKHLSGFKSFIECFPHERVAGKLILCAVEQPLFLSDDCLALPWWYM